MKIKQINQSCDIGAHVMSVSATVSSLQAYTVINYYFDVYRYMYLAINFSFVITDIEY